MHNIATGRPDDVRVLHQIIFSRPGRPYEFRRNLRLFRGFAFAADSPSFVKKRENLEKYRLDVLRSLSRILDLDRKSGTREELALAILRFLCDPKPSGREVKKKRKRKSKGKAGPGVKKPRKKKAAEGDEAGDDVGSGSESGSDDDDDDDDVGGAGDAEEPKKVIKKKKEPSPKKAPAKSTPAKKAAVKAGVKKTPKKRKAQEAGAEPAGSSSEDDEPLQKKPKAGKPPTNGEIRTLVSKLLHGANLEEVTMKNILTKVYAKYPQHDLTARKDFIKATVKSLIS
ncbi:protein DEK-like [Pollicipes pollicipes]|uniref:protein DEK-like n=1 Tax=Pollicipes pollicipes TaxID=41117 RepID=UPI001884E02D|nr:protein DEK-like [Pollicipes pollicipes]